MIVKNISILADKGLKSIVFAGEGEPLLHKDAPYIVNQAKSFGIDCAMSTNGVFLTEDKAEQCLKSLTWIRFSVAAATEETYKKIQRGRDGDFQRVIQNISTAVKIKRRDNLGVTIGVQMLLLPDNQNEVLLMAEKMRDIGVDYLTVKPFIQHIYSNIKKEVDYSSVDEVNKKIHEYETENFKIQFRSHAIDNLSHEKMYNRCYALPFMVHIAATGQIFPCCIFVGNEKLCYGNLYEKDFDKIWENEHTQQIMEIFQGDFLKKNCNKACRLDEMNKYLYELKNPGLHVNFI